MGDNNKISPVDNGKPRLSDLATDPSAPIPPTESQNQRHAEPIAEDQPPITTTEDNAETAEISGLDQNEAPGEPKALTLEEIEEMKKAEAGSDEEGHFSDLSWNISIQWGMWQSVPRDLGISPVTYEPVKVFIPPIETETVIASSPCNIIAMDDCNTIFEPCDPCHKKSHRGWGCESDYTDRGYTFEKWHIGCQTGHDNGPITATGNILENDYSNNPFTICAFSFEGSAQEIMGDGFITLITEAGTITLYTGSVNCHMAGDYVYTLNPQNPCSPCVDDSPQVFHYTICSDAGCMSSADLTIKIVDAPLIICPDKPVCAVESCYPKQICGDVLDKGNIKCSEGNVHVVSFNYDDGCKTANICFDPCKPHGGSAEVTIAQDYYCGINTCQSNEVLNFSEVLCCPPKPCESTDNQTLFNAVLNSHEQNCSPSYCQPSPPPQTHCVITHPLECCTQPPSCEIQQG